MEVRGDRLDAAIQIPAVVVLNLVEQRGAPCALRGRGVVFREQRKDVFRARTDAFIDRGVVVEREGLRQVSSDQIAAAREA